MKNEKIEQYLLSHNKMSYAEVARRLFVSPSAVTHYMQVEMTDEQQEEIIEKLERSGKDVREEKERA